MTKEEKEGELITFLTETVGMDEEEIEERAQELVDNDEVLLKVNAYERIKEENVAQPQETTDITGAFLGATARTDSDGEIFGYLTWVFSEDTNQVEQINSDEALVDNQGPRPFTKVTVTDVDRMENLETGYSWNSASEDTTVNIEEDELLVDLVLDYAQTVGDVEEEGQYLVIADIDEVDTLGDFHEETGEFLGQKPVIEDEDTSNVRLRLTEPRTGDAATIKIKDPRTLADLAGTDFERLMRISADADAYETAQQLTQVLEGEQVVIFGRGSLYVNDEMVTDGDDNPQPWLTLSGFDAGFIRSVDELEVELAEA